MGFSPLQRHQAPVTNLSPWTWLRLTWARATESIATGVKSVLGLARDDGLPMQVNRSARAVFFFPVCDFFTFSHPSRHWTHHIPTGLEPPQPPFLRSQRVAPSKSGTARDC